MFNNNKTSLQRRKEVGKNNGIVKESEKITRAVKQGRRNFSKYEKRKNIKTLVKGTGGVIETRGAGGGLFLKLPAPFRKSITEHTHTSNVSNFETIQKNYKVCRTFEYQLYSKRLSSIIICLLKCI